MDESLWTEPVGVIRQGAQYYLPVRARIGGYTVTPENADDVIIQIGEQPKKLSTGELEFEEGYWLYPLTQEFTMKLHPGDVKIQISVQRGKFVYPAAVRRICVDASIIKELFGRTE